jgi:hypothetical protein
MGEDGDQKPPRLAVGEDLTISPPIFCRAATTLAATLGSRCTLAPERPPATFRRRANFPHYRVLLRNAPRNPQPRPPMEIDLSDGGARGSAGHARRVRASVVGRGPRGDHGAVAGLDGALMARGKITALEAMQRELELAVVERDVELAGAGGDPCGRRVIEARRRVIDVATRLLPYQTPRLEVVASLPVSKPLHAYSDDELWAIVIENAEREKENAPPANGNGASTPMIEHDDDVLHYGKNC